MSTLSILKKDSPCADYVRIGVFFDGTGNNRFNDIGDRDKIKVRDQHVPLERAEWQKRGDSNNSPLAVFNRNAADSDKEDKRSNIAKLFALYKDSEDEHHNKLRKNYSIYKEGVGTSAGYNDSSKEQATGSGGAKRVNEAIKEVVTILNKYPAKQFDRKIDVFGFSRGAALARDFINTFNHQNLRDDYMFTFVGIFDTVGSFGVGGNNTNYKPRDPAKHSEFSYIAHKAADKGGISRGKQLFGGESLVDKYYEPYNFNLHSNSAYRIVHMSALDEIRYTFPLSNIRGVDGGQHSEWRYLGVHSDIGGGYAAKFNDDQSDVLAFVGSKSFIRSKTTAIEQYRQQQLAKGYYVDVITEYGALGVLKTVRSYDQRIVKPDLSKVCLHLMHMEAIKHPLLTPFDDLPGSREFNVPADLNGYLTYVKKRPASAESYASGNSEAEMKERENIYKNYVHRSHGKSFEADGLKKRASMFPRRKWLGFGAYERKEFDNEPQKAVLKAN